MKVKNCILCDGPVLTTVLDLGDIPLPNRLPHPEDPPDTCYPLDVVRCTQCGHNQLGHIVEPLLMFQDYPYVPSNSAFFRDHFESLARVLTRRFRLKKTDLVVDIGSNDGLLLSYFKSYGVQVLGIDPAENLKEAAEARGVPTLTKLFDEHVGHELHNTARIVTATNCLAHTANLRSFLAGVADMLTDNGVFIVEVPYLGGLLSENQLDTIYHEHQSYFALTPLYNNAPDFGLYVAHVQKIPAHGGSLRIFFERKYTTHPSASKVEVMLGNEKTWLFAEKTFQRFRERCEVVKQGFPQLLGTLQRMNGRIVGHAASAKAAILLNYCRVGKELIESVVDSNPRKIGRCIPGVRIPIFGEDTLTASRPDYVVALSWTLMDDVQRVVRTYCPGAAIVVGIPDPQVISCDRPSLVNAL